MEISDQLDTLKNRIENSGLRMAEAEWDRFVEQASEVSVKKNTIIFRQTEICRETLCITDGIAASEFVVDGKKVITNMNIESAAHANCDNLISITPLRAILSMELKRNNSPNHCLHP